MREMTANNTVGEIKVKKTTQISCLFLDIGGVLLTDGWNIHSRRRAAAKFDLDFSAMEDRHRLCSRYTRKANFRSRNISNGRFSSRTRIYSRSVSEVHVCSIKRGRRDDPVDPHSQGKVRSENGRGQQQSGGELNEYRIRKFNLGEFVDAFISSCFVGVRKPDPDIFRLALDVAQVPQEQIVYIENTAMFVDVAEGLEIQSILHTDHQSTIANLADFGFQITTEQPGNRSIGPMAFDRESRSGCSSR